MAEVICLYPPFTQPTMIYPSSFVVGTCFERLGLDVRVIDANIQFFCNILDPLCTSDSGDPRAERIAEACTNLLAKRSLMASHWRSDKSIEGFVAKLRRTETYSNYADYEWSARLLSIALRVYGQSLGYANLELDKFDGDAHLDEPDSLTSFVELLLRTDFATFMADIVMSSGLEYEGVACISAAFRTQIIPSIVLARVLRKVYPQSLIVLGGAAITCLREEPEQLKEVYRTVDVLSFGQAEAIIPMLAGRWFEEGELRPSDSTRNLIVTNERTRSQHRSLTSPKPSSNWLLDLTRTIVKNADHTYCSPDPYLPLPAARGCYWNKCTFCFEYGNDAINTVSTSEQVIEAMNFGLSHGYHNFFIGEGAVTPQLAAGIGERVRDLELPVQWLGFFRLEKNVTPAVVSTMAAGGCKLALFGLESATQKLQNDMRKGVLMSRATEVLKVAADNGVWNHVLLMFGYPTETEQDAAQTVEYVIKYSDRIHSLAASIFMLDKASELYLRNQLPMGLELTERNKAGLELHVKFNREENYNPDAYRAAVIRYGQESLAMRSVRGMHLGHELLFYRRVMDTHSNMRMLNVSA